MTYLKTQCVCVLFIPTENQLLRVAFDYLMDFYYIFSYLKIVMG